MRGITGSFLASLAVLSMVIFCTPAGAGMVATPDPAKASDEVREAAIAGLQTRLAEGGMAPAGLEEGMRALPTADLLALSGSVESARRAGYHYFLAALGICAAAFAVFAICYWGFYRHSHGHHEHDCD